MGDLKQLEAGVIKVGESFKKVLKKNDLRSSGNEYFAQVRAWSFIQKIIWGAVRCEAGRMWWTDAPRNG